MTTEGGQDPRNDRAMDDIVARADELYVALRKRQADDTRLHVVVIGLCVWFATFAVLGLGALFTIKSGGVMDYLVGAFLAGVAAGAAAGLVTYAVYRRRRFKFADLGALIARMKEGGASSEDGLRLMDAMHRASLALREKKMDAAIEYGVLVFAGVSAVGDNAAVGALAGVVAYLYFRFEAVRSYEREEKRYEDSKRDLLQSL
jgi:hypothetical protein